MIYNAEDKWNEDAPHLEHRSHKYYMKIGQGPTARYFYSPQEYAAYQNAARRGGDTQNLRGANAAQYRYSSNRLNNTQVRREQQAAAARNESRLIAKKNVRLNSRDSNDVRNLNNTNNRAQLEKNRAIDRLKKTQVRKEQQSASAANKRELAGKRREARKQAYVDFQRNRGKSTTSPQPKTADDTQRLKNRANSMSRSANRTKQMKKDNAQKRYNKANKPIITRKINLGGGKSINQTVLGTEDVRRAVNKVKNKAKKTANTAYKSAKKAYNSKQGKAVRKKVKRTAQSAYKRGSSFVKKLFNR